MKEIKTKSGKTIILRSLQESDFPAVYGWVKKVEAEDTFVLINAKEPIGLDEEKVFYEGLMKAIANKQKISIGAWDGDKYIGNCSVEKMGRRQGHIGSLGITLLKDYRSSGIGRQLLEYALEEAKKELGVSRIILNCFANNKIGCKFYDSLGFKTYGRLEKAIMYQGKLEDELMFYKDLA
jgi:RimJ/RimL family protein N-acetyltransferase